MASAVGTALGALIVTWLLDLSWPVRIAVAVLVALVVLAVLLVRRRGTGPGDGEPAAPALTTPTIPSTPSDPAGGDPLP